jgi:hypothetical protein
LTVLVSDGNDTFWQSKVRARHVCALGGRFLGPGEFSREVEMDRLKRGHLLGIWN